MKTHKYFSLIFLTFIVLGSSTASAQHDLAQQAYAVLQQNCLTCHGPAGAFRETLLLDHTALLETGGSRPSGNLLNPHSIIVSLKRTPSNGCHSVNLHSQTQRFSQSRDGSKQGAPELVTDTQLQLSLRMMRCSRLFNDTSNRWIPLIVRSPVILRSPTSITPGRVLKP